MVVVYNCDERFAGIFATSVLSLFENNKHVNEITVYLIEKGVSEESKIKFQQLSDNYGRKIITLPMPDLERLAGVEVAIPTYNRMATCGRLFIASLLPEIIDKVIYVDSDTIFTDSIVELWETDISGYAAGMVDGAHNALFRTQLGLKPNGIYYNSGLILVNLKYWREKNVEKEFLKYIKSQGGYIPFPDEGVLNAVFDGEILTLPLRYNVMTQVYTFSHKQLCRIRGLREFYSPKEMADARKRPVMVHFTSNFYLPERPWMKNCRHPYTGRYLNYKKLTPWAEAPLWDDPRNNVQKIYTKLCHVIPKPIVIEMSRFISLYLTPLMHRYKKWHHIHQTERMRVRGGIS